MKSRNWLPALVCFPVLLSAACLLEAPYAKYAIVYGISDYEGAIHDLQYAAADATEMAAMLTGQGYSVQERIDAAATKTQLLEDIAAAASAAKEEDLFLFYFSGHGGQPDTGPESAAGDKWNECIYLNGPEAMTDDELVSALALIPCRHKVVILDSCASGGFIGNELEADNIPPSLLEGGRSLLATLGSAISLYANFDGSSADIPPWKALVLSASGERESSYEKDYPFNHGVFTYFLLQAERRADRNRDGSITATEAYDYIRDRINADSIRR